jgi:hypothetical protein
MLTEELNHPYATDKRYIVDRDAAMHNRTQAKPFSLIREFHLADWHPLTVIFALSGR